MRLACAAIFFLQMIAFAAAAGYCAATNSSGAPVGLALAFANLLGFVIEMHRWLKPRPRGGAV